MSQLLRNNKISNLDYSDLKQKDKSDLDLSSGLNTNKDAAERIVIKITNQDVSVQVIESKVSFEANDVRKEAQTNEYLNRLIKIWIKIKDSNKFKFQNSKKWIEIKDVFCDTSFRSADILIVIGIMKITIGLCVLLIGSTHYAYLDDQKVKYYD